MLEFCYIMAEKKENSLTAVLVALLNKKKMTQKELAYALDTTPSNLSARLKAGSMTSKMMRAISKILGEDLVALIVRHEAGESVESILDNKEPKLSESIEFELTTDEVKEVLLNAKKDQDQLKQEFNQLVGQIKTWIQHDLEKSRRQEELINMLLEERAEYKAKKK